MDFCAQLRTTAKRAQLSTADLQHWFGRPYSTVRTWHLTGRVPRGYPGAAALSRLQLLTEAVKNKEFDNLQGISAHERPARIEQLRQTYERRRVSQCRSAG